MLDLKIKTCKNCKYYTGIQCHGFGDYWGECRKNKNTLFCNDDTPCMQDIKNLRNLYWKQKEEINQLEAQNTYNQFYKERYAISQRRLEKYIKWYNLARSYIPKQNYKEFLEKFIEIKLENENEKQAKNITTKQN